MIEIHADYNRDGRIELGSGDYSVRRNGLGAVVVPNLDADGRFLPSDAAVAPGITLDLARTTKSAADDELLRFKIRLTTFPLPAGARVELSLLNMTGNEANIYDGGRRRLLPQPRSAGVYDLSVGNAISTFFLELTSFSSSPTNTLVSGIAISVAVIDAQANRLAEDSGRFRIAPLILTGDVGTAQRMYIAEVPQNSPSTRDVTEAVRRIGLPLSIIPVAQNSGDTWIQDQFQLGYSQSPTGIIQMILHLPRMRSDSLSSPGRANLSTFVDGHFPSRNLGIFNDFWTRQLQVIDAQGTIVQIPLRQAEHIQHQIERAHRLLRWIMVTLRRLDRASFDRENPIINTFFDIRTNIRRLTALADGALRRGETSATDGDERDFYRRERTALQTAVREFESAVPATATTVTLTGPSISAEIAQFTLNSFESDLNAKLSSLNYGGNVEISPPFVSAPFGKIVLGSRSFEDGRGMDPDLLVFLEGQGIQPLVNVHTAWLDVGHVDEVMSFVPSPRYGNSGFSILRASPQIALKILRAARNLFQSGISSALWSTFNPAYSVGYYERDTRIGTHPVTHMLRGKFWLHRHQTGPTAPEPLEPPRIYKEMVRHWRYSIVNSMRYVPGPGDDRHYPANLSILEFSHFENITNGIIEDILLAERPTVPDAVSGGGVPPQSPTPDEQVDETFNDGLVGEGLPLDRKREFREFLDGVRLDHILRREFADVPILGLPVLFDRLDDWVNETTSAFLPDLINLQQSGNHVLLPRPYGPRMNVADAITVLSEVMGTFDASFRRNLNARALAARGLDQTWHWQHGGIDSTDRVTGRDIARYFRDGFTESQDEVARMILRHRRNGGRFAGDYVQRGWQKILIPENKVDLFETYTHLVLERLGLTVHWVDSWYYHLHFGGIHCGTNCLRPVDIRARSAWWTRPITSSD